MPVLLLDYNVVGEMMSEHEMHKTATIQEKTGSNCIQIFILNSSKCEILSNQQQRDIVCVCVRPSVRCYNGSGQIYVRHSLNSMVFHSEMTHSPKKKRKPMQCVHFHATLLNWQQK